MVLFNFVVVVPPVYEKYDRYTAKCSYYDFYDHILKNISIKNQWMLLHVFYRKVIVSRTWIMICQLSVPLLLLVTRRNGSLLSVRLSRVWVLSRESALWKKPFFCYYYDLYSKNIIVIAFFDLFIAKVRLLRCLLFGALFSNLSFLKNMDTSIHKCGFFLDLTPQYELELFIFVVIGVWWEFSWDRENCFYLFFQVDFWKIVASWVMSV